MAFANIPSPSATEYTGSFIAAPSSANEVLTSTGTSPGAWSWQVPALPSTSTLNYPIILDPTIEDGLVFGPTTTAGIGFGVAPTQVVGLSTTDGNPHVAMLLPIPGNGSGLHVIGSQSGIIPVSGSILVDIDVAQSGPTGAGAGYKFFAGWSCGLSGSSPHAFQSTPVTATSTIGTNSGSPPVGYGCNIILDASNRYIEVVVTGSSGTIVDHLVKANVLYVQ